MPAPVTTLLPAPRRLGDADLSEREAEVVRLLATGMRNQAIADELYIGAETVKSHLKVIYRKLGVSNRTEATAVALADAEPSGAGDAVDPVEDDVVPTLTIRERSTSRGRADGAALAVSGEIDIASAARLESALLAAMTASGSVRLDLSGVSFIDSSGLRALVTASALGPVVIDGASRQVERMLRLTGLGERFGLGGPQVDSDAGND